MTEGDAARRVTRISAYAVSLDGADRLLLCRVAPGSSVGFDGWWTLPGGGLDHGEDPRDAALRELTEETGLIGELDGLLEVDSWRTLFTNLAGEREDFHGIRFLYRCRIVGGELRDEAEGSTDTCRWFARSELPAERLVDIGELAVRLVL
ncbi:MAG: NUDIX domain-containing protein [Chloroflexi bacterium]|nr:NUDIX domain-containing protein [Chloroflexota bacterium]